MRIVGRGAAPRAGTTAAADVGECLEAGFGVNIGLPLPIEKIVNVRSVDGEAARGRH